MHKIKIFSLVVKHIGIYLLPFNPMLIRYKITSSQTFTTFNNNKCATLLGKYTQKGGKRDKAEPPDFSISSEISFDH